MVVPDSSGAIFFLSIVSTKTRVPSDSPATEVALTLACQGEGYEGKEEDEKQ